MIKLTAPPRANDKHGSGAWQAPRSYGKHNGIDYATWPDSLVHSSSIGLVTKLGYMYNDDLSYRYVQITTPLGYVIRYAYVQPLVELGTSVSKDQVLGAVQDIGERYEGITPHIHVSVKDPQGAYVNPEMYFGEMQ